jgi:uncharacterized protein DUF3008
MPAKSKKQQMAAGAALSAKRGESPKSSLKGASKQMVESMSEKQLEEFAATKRKKLPTKKTAAKSSGAKKPAGKKAASSKAGKKK